jgi:acylphosphatase
MAASYRFIVSGRVQGVFFRQSTIDTARGLGLDGWVMNRADGRVEGLAAGDGAALQALREWLSHGPPQARVDAVDWMPDDEHTTPGFHLRTSP